MHCHCFKRKPYECIGYLTSHLQIRRSLHFTSHLPISPKNVRRAAVKSVILEEEPWVTRLINDTQQNTVSVLPGCIYRNTGPCENCYDTGSLGASEGIVGVVVQHDAAAANKGNGYERLSMSNSCIVQRSL